MYLVVTYESSVCGVCSSSSGVFLWFVSFGLVQCEEFFSV